MRKIFFIFFLIFLSTLSLQKQIFIDCSDGEQVLIQQLFSDVEEGFYADLGCYDPFALSNTFNLHSKGWGGLTLDANFSRSHKFNFQRPQAINLNYAIGQKDSIVTLYEFVDQSVATINQKVKDTLKASLIGETKVAAITLGQLCDRYFYKRPNLMSFDLEGYAYEAFVSNNWENPKCFPQVLISQLNSFTKMASQKLPSQILKEHGYQILVKDFANNQIYVHQSVYEQYSKKFKAGQELFKKRKSHKSLQVIIKAFNSLANSNINFRRYNQSTEKIYIHASRNNENLDLLKINKYSNAIGKGNLNRILGIMNFNPHKSIIIVPYNNYTHEKIQYNQFKFHKITVFKSDDQKFQTLILDHSYQPIIQPTIVSIQNSKQNKKKQIAPQNQQKHQIISANMSEFKLFTQQLLGSAETKMVDLKKQLNQQFKALQNKLNDNTNLINSLSSTLKMKQQYQSQEKTQNFSNLDNTLLLSFLGILIAFLGLLLKVLLDQRKKISYLQCNSQEGSSISRSRQSK